MRTIVPVLQPRVWGGDQLAKLFPQCQAEGPIGEAWLLSDHPSGKTVDEDGRPLGDLVKEDKWFPVMIKILHANTDLSVQVHPNDEQAAAIGDLGKTEGWLILDAKPGARVCHGHTAHDAEEMRRLIAQERLGDCLRYVTVAKGDYYSVPPGTVHALCGGIIAIEVQQASDTTYRLYDYQRRDQKGNLRELHVEAGLAVTVFPQPPAPQGTEPAVVDAPGSLLQSVARATRQEQNGKADGVCECDLPNAKVYENHRYYSVTSVEIDGECTLAPHRGMIICVVLLAGHAKPEQFGREPAIYQTWLFEEDEPARLHGKGTVVVVRIPMQ